MIIYGFIYIPAILFFHILFSCIFPAKLLSSKLYTIFLLIIPSVAFAILCILVDRLKELIKSHISNDPDNNFDTLDNKDSAPDILDSKQVKQSESSAPVIHTPHQPTPEEILDKVDHMDGLGFERWCAQLLQLLEFSDIKLTKASGDQGVDIITIKNEIRYAIQCKCYSSDLGNHPAQEVHAGKSIYHCHVGVVMTNRYFTSGAQELAKATDTLLWDRDKLRAMLQKIPKENRVKL